MTRLINCLTGFICFFLILVSVGENDLTMALVMLGALSVCLFIETDFLRGK